MQLVQQMGEVWVFKFPFAGLKTFATTFALF